MPCSLMLGNFQHKLRFTKVTRMKNRDELADDETP